MRNAAVRAGADGAAGTGVNVHFNESNPHCRICNGTGLCAFCGGTGKETGTSNYDAPIAFRLAFTAILGAFLYLFIADCRRLGSPPPLTWLIVAVFFVQGLHQAWKGVKRDDFKPGRRNR